MSPIFRKPILEESMPLTLTNAAGEPVRTFPGPIVDKLRQMVTRIGQENGLPACLSLVAALRGEGVSYLAQALGATIANDMALRICIVDLNWWWPSVTSLADPDNGGLASVLGGEATLDEVLVSTGWPDLAYLPAGSISRQNRPIIARSQILQEAIGELSERFDHLILDIPAVLATSDAVPLASLGTACCLVVRQGVTHVEDVNMVLSEIQHLAILGVVLNRVKLSSPRPLVKMTMTIT